MIWLTVEDALALHTYLIESYGGAHGVRDLSLMESALERPKNLHYYTGNASLSDIAAAYCHGIVKNHPFVDGNKRMGLGLCEMFLLSNGFKLGADAIELSNQILALASSGIKQEQFAGWLSQFISAVGSISAA